MENNIKNKFFINVSWISIGKAIQLLMSFICSLLVARYLGPDKFGLIGYAYSYVAIFSPFCTLGLNDIVVKELLDKKNNTEKVLGSIIVIRLVSSIFTIGFIYLAVRLMGNNPVVIMVCLLQALSLIFQCFDTITYFYQSKLLSKKTAVINIIAYTLSTIFRFVCFLIKKDINYFALAVSLDFALVGVLLLFIYLKEGNKLKFSFDVAKQLLKKSSSYFFAGIMIAVYSKADSLLLGKMIDETSVGYYTAATTICNAWPFILQAIIDSASPIIIDLYNTDKNKYVKTLKNLYASIFYIGLIVGIIICLCSPLIIKLLYGESYIPAITPLRILCFGTIFSYFGVSRYIFMQCEGKTKYEKPIYFFGAIFNVLLNIILISKLGIIGAALALVLTQFFTNFILVFIIKETRQNAIYILNAIMLKGIK